MKKVAISILVVLSTTSIAFAAKETTIGNTNVKSNSDGTTTISEKGSSVKEHTNETHKEAVDRVKEENKNKGK
jgi:hypothetical protein